MRILVADDDADTVASTAMLLRLTGHEVETAGDGQTAITLAMRQPPDLMLVDLAMPGLDGLEVARQVRAHPALQHTCLVCVSGYGHEAYRQQALAAGFHAHLLKPMDFEHLQDILADARRLCLRTSALLEQSGHLLQEAREHVAGLRGCQAERRELSRQAAELRHDKSADR